MASPGWCGRDDSRDRAAMRVGRVRRLRAVAVLLLFAQAALFSAAVAAVTVQVTGRVAHAGSQQLDAGARLSQAMLAAEVTEDAYVLGAAWLRASLRMEQARLKAGVLYELDLAAAASRLRSDAALTDLTVRLRSEVRGLPVTGRQPGALLDPRPLEISAHNHRLAEGDRLFYPARPSHVRVMGAVERNCILPHVPLQPAQLYLRACPLAAADPDWLYIIQPDGTVQRHGIALWNRDAPQALAPGAVLYVPIRVPAPASASLNEELARLLATQPLPDPDS